MGRFLERFNTEFQIGIRTDEFGRPVDDHAGPSIRQNVDEQVENQFTENVDVEGENVDEQVEKQAREEVAVKEAAAKELAEKEDAEKALKEASAKEAAAKELAKKEDAEEAVKEAVAKEAAAKEHAKKEDAQKGAEEEKEKVAKEEAKKKQEAEKYQEALKLKAEQERAQKEAEKELNEKRKAAAKELNEKRSKEKALTEDERLLAYSLFSMEGDILDNVFDDGKGTTVPRITMQLLSPGVLIDSLHPEIQNGKKNLNKQIETLMGILNKDETSFKLRDVKLVFFPIIAHKHYYVIVFDLDKGHAVILDNTLQKMMKDAPAKISKMKWRTKENKIDCGLYMMMHMEMFEGEIGLKWKTNILDERNRQYAEQIKRMRMRYTSKILLHDANKNTKMMSDFAIKFDEEHNDKEEQKKMVEEAMIRKASEEKH
ncbi:ankyrin repeat-containing protein [Artemisia annua]|uniref:Ankyrin repeat-containing protein n=1 Tax=Artemisia annua TaxID=35608 RepID=A0A2U1K950_ARTAN|nr:ankyrin repeat-containing protein [Artemisia annua]